MPTTNYVNSFSHLEGLNLKFCIKTSEIPPYRKPIEIFFLKQIDLAHHLKIWIEKYDFVRRFKKKGIIWKTNNMRQKE